MWRHRSTGIDFVAIRVSKTFVYHDVFPPRALIVLSRTTINCFFCIACERCPASCSIVVPRRGQMCVAPPFSLDLAAVTDVSPTSGSDTGFVGMP